MPVETIHQTSTAQAPEARDAERPYVKPEQQSVEAFLTAGGRVQRIPEMRTLKNIKSECRCSKCAQTIAPGEWMVMEMGTTHTQHLRCPIGDKTGRDSYHNLKRRKGW